MGKNCQELLSISFMISFLRMRESFSLNLISSAIGSVCSGPVVLFTLVLRKMSKMLLDLCFTLPSVKEMFLFREALRVNVAFLSYFTYTLPMRSVLRRMVLDTRES